MRNTMGADSFITIYGIRYELTDSEIESCETRSDERMKRARKAKLDFCFDRPTDGERYFLYIGTTLASIRVEAERYETMTEGEFSAKISETRRRLQDAGFNDEPSLHFQLIAQI
jgi:hypothetical protein